MPYGVLADVVLVLHIGFVLFVVLGGMGVLWWPRLAWVHLPAAAWGAIVELAGWPCPLTPLEVWLRRAAGEAGYVGGFLDRYLFSLLYPQGLTRGQQVVLGLLVLVLNGVIYGLAWRRRHART
jgi:hypothetical protein